MKNTLGYCIALIVALAIMSLGIAITVAWFREGNFAAIGICTAVGGFILAVGTITGAVEAFEKGKAEAEYQEFKNRDKGHHPFGYLKNSTGGSIVKFTSKAVLEMAIANGDIVAYGYFFSHEDAGEEFAKRYSIRVHYLVSPKALR